MLAACSCAGYDSSVQDSLLPQFAANKIKLQIQSFNAIINVFFTEIICKKVTVFVANVFTSGTMGV